VQVNSTNYVYSGLGCDCESNAAGSTYYTHDNRGQLIDERTPSGTYYYLFDGLGSVVGLTDSTGALVGNETYQYDPYGSLIHQPRTTALQQNAWRFASGYYDVSTGMYKFGIRYYNPGVGRWTQRDPVGGSLAETTKGNPYVYANDDPVNMVDPSGRDGITNVALFDCIGSVIVAAAVGFGTDLAIDAALELGSVGLLTPVVIIALIIEIVIGAGYLFVAVAEKCPFLLG
jgi:RHS repeat-associated protein